MGLLVECVYTRQFAYGIMLRIRVYCIEHIVYSMLLRGRQPFTLYCYDVHAHYIVFYLCYYLFIYLYKVLYIHNNNNITSYKCIYHITHHIVVCSPWIYIIIVLFCGFPFKFSTTVPIVSTIPLLRPNALQIALFFLPGKMLCVWRPFHMFYSVRKLVSFLQENLVERKHHRLARSARAGVSDRDAKPTAR